MKRLDVGVPREPEAILGVLDGEVVKKIARTLGIGKGLTRKADLAQAISAHLRTHLAEALAQCSEIERHALAEAAYEPEHTVVPAVFSGKYGAGFPACPSAYQVPSISPYHAFVAREEDGTLAMSAGTAEALKALLPKPSAASLATVSAPPEAHRGRPMRVYEGERTVWTELRQMLGLIRGGRVRVAPKSGAPTEASVRTLSGALAVPDLDLEQPERERGRWYQPGGAVRAYAWGTLTQSCGWARAKGEALELTRAGQDMLSSGAPEALRDGFRRFLASTDFDELRRIDNIRGQTGNARRALVSVAERKAAIAAAMRGWPVGAWISFDEAARFQLASGHAFQVCRSSWGLYFCERQYGSLGYSGGEGGLERQYLRVFLMEPMATLGLVDLAYVEPHGLWPEFDGWWGTDDCSYCGRYDGLLSVRLNGLGAFGLDRSDGYSAPARVDAAPCRFLPNLDVAVTVPTLSPGDACALAMCAERTGDNLWRVSRSAVLKYLDQGGSVGDLRRIMAELAEGGIPANVAVFLDDIERKAGSIRAVEKALLIDCGDAATAAAIGADAATRSLCLRAGENHVAVAERNGRAFKTAMKKLGYVLPA
jgi:hypothetical protein